jgi:hypothetical protein
MHKQEGQIWRCSILQAVQILITATQDGTVKRYAFASQSDCRRLSDMQRNSVNSDIIIRVHDR